MSGQTAARSITMRIARCAGYGRPRSASCRIDFSTPGLLCNTRPF